jgi:ketosteroid isomerase-like protein
MSQENIEVARAAYDAWNRGDLKAALEHARSDVRFVQDSRIPGAVDLSGRGAVQAWLESFYETWEEFRVAPDRIEPVGDRILILATIRAKGRMSQAEVEQRMGHVFTVRDGQIVEWRSYADPEDALEAVGLSQ